MIDVVAVLALLLIFGIGSRWVGKDDPTDKHSVFCIGLCTHVQETHPDPNDPEVHEIENTTTVIGGPKVIRWKSPAEQQE